MNAGHERHSGPYFFLVNPLPRELIARGLCTVEDVWPAGLWDLAVAGETTSQRNRRRKLAARVCDECPVRKLCASYAEENGESGMWGGVVFVPEVRKRRGSAGKTRTPHREVRRRGRHAGASRSA